MAKKIDERTFEAVKAAYLECDSKPDRPRLARKFKIGLSTLNNWAAENKWEELRASTAQSRSVGRVEGAKAAVRQRPKVDDLTLLNDGIADLSAEIASIDAKSKEGCATAMASLIKIKRELFPPTAEDLAEMAVSLGITPSDFLTALQRRWQKQQELAPQPVE